MGVAKENKMKTAAIITAVLYALLAATIAVAAPTLRKDAFRSFANRKIINPLLYRLTAADGSRHTLFGNLLE